LNEYKKQVEVVGSEICTSKLSANGMTAKHLLEALDTLQIQQTNQTSTSRGHTFRNVKLLEIF
jgi:hypothetical protein